MTSNIDKEYAILLNKLVMYCCTNLKIKKPTITLINNDNYAQENHSFASYRPDNNTIAVVVKNRNLADVCRSVAHEIKHSQQNSQNQLTAEAGKDGDKFENEANSYSGMVMRKFGRENPKIYTLFL